MPSINAFTTNHLGRLGPAGIVREFFPLELKVSQQGPVTDAYVCAQKVVDVCDLIETHCREHVVLFDVAHEPFRHLSREPNSLVDLATQARIPFSAVDSETVVLPSRALSALLSDLYHYDLSLFDIGTDWSEIQVIEQVLACREADSRNQSIVLSRLPASEFFLHSHDDCYLTIESYRPLVAKQLFARTLGIYLGTVLSEEGLQIDEIPEITADLLDEFWRDGLELTVLRGRTELQGDQLRIGVSEHAVQHGSSTEYTMAYYLVYKVSSQRWILER